MFLPQKFLNTGLIVCWLTDWLYIHNFVADCSLFPWYGLLSSLDTRNHESATARVRIQVLDVNDNKPYFLKQNYKEKLSTLPEPGTVVANVVAQDDDRGKNRELEYSLVSGGGGYFRVNSK